MFFDCCLTENTSQNRSYYCNITVEVLNCCVQEIRFYTKDREIVMINLFLPKTPIQVAYKTDFLKCCFILVNKQIF